MRKAGRPRIEINWDEFEKLCSIQCTLGEMAAWFRCSEDTIERSVKRHYGIDFADVFAQKRGHGKIALRRRMFASALEGNNTMLIWLSKQHLGMVDKVESKTDITSNGEKIETTPLVVVLPAKDAE